MERMAWQRVLPITWVALLACGGDAPPSPNVVRPPAVARVDVSPAAVFMVVGNTATLTASTFDAGGASLSGRTVDWSSTNVAIATVSPAGVVTGVAAGSATITASSEGRSGSAQVTVTAPVARVSLAPVSLALTIGATAQLIASTFDAAGNTLTGRQVTFLSSNPAVATVSPTGLVTGVAAGTTPVAALSEGQSASAAVTVSSGAGGAVTRVSITPSGATIPVGATTQLTATAFDAQGNVVTAGTVLWTTSNATVAGVSASGLVTAIAAGAATLTATISGIAGTVTVTITPGVPSGNVIDVNPGVAYQTMTGWQALTQNGWLDCNATAFSNYKNQLHDRAVNELGINRMTIMLRSGAENTRDWYTDFVNGQVDQATWRSNWFVPINDNSDPNVADPARFHWGWVDGQVDNAILPLQQRLQARGERLYVVLQYVDFTQGNTSKPFLPMSTPAEYAELVVETFKHLKQKYNIVPDAYEMVLEPEHTPYYAPDVGRAIVATVNRLKAAGFNPAIIAPSTTSMLNAHQWYDTMLLTPGIQGMITELAYHRYVAVSLASLQAIGQRVVRDNIKSSMLEHIGSGFDDLYEDLTVGMASSWQQFTLAFCGQRDNPDNDGVYYQINQADPANPNVNITNYSKLFRQLFMYVRLGAVRIGATSGNATDLQPVAFRNTNGKLVAVVRARKGASFQVRGLTAGTYGINYGTSGAQWNVGLPDQVVAAGGSVQASIPTDGVITIYGR